MQQHKTPGVYIIEEDAFSNAIVPMPTAVPVFVGYTQHAQEAGVDLTNVAVRVNSFNQYKYIFGAAPRLSVSRDAAGHVTCTSPFLMHRAVELFYNNGGGDCYIFSVGPYVDGLDNAVVPHKAAILAALKTLEETPEITMVLTPDTALMTLGDWSDIANTTLRHCAKMRNRIALIDLVNGDCPLEPAADIDPIGDFRANINAEQLSYGAAYYPWLNTSIVEMDDLSFLDLNDDFRASLQKEVEDQAASNERLKTVAQSITSVTQTDDAAAVHFMLMAASPAYAQVMQKVRAAVNVIPPSAAVAGVITMMDDQVGPWQAPANVALMSVVSPTVEISDHAQADLNVPVDGKAVGAIRSFTGRGVLIWGARTLDGNSTDWRYVSVRRTQIHIEQTAKSACEMYAFLPNDANTWQEIKNTISVFLTDLWKLGGITGDSPQHAFEIDIGLGNGMTETDILNGQILVSIKVSLVYPSEYVLIEIRQDMQS